MAKKKPTWGFPQPVGFHEAVHSEYVEGKKSAYVVQLVHPELIGLELRGAPDLIAIVHLPLGCVFREVFRQLEPRERDLTDDPIVEGVLACWDGTVSPLVRLESGRFVGRITRRGRAGNGHRIKLRPPAEKEAYALGVKMLENFQSGEIDPVPWPIEVPTRRGPDWYWSAVWRDHFAEGMDRPEYVAYEGYAPGLDTSTDISFQGVVSK